MLPSPITPSVRLKSSMPTKLFLSHLPAFIDAVACGMWRASATSSAIACSAVVTVLPPGVFITTMPRAVAAPTSTLSTPIPARPITASCFAAAITSAVTVVALRMISASASATASSSCAGFMPGMSSTSRPGTRSRISKPWGASPSVTRILATASPLER
jgi:hypothetical protein